MDCPQFGQKFTFPSVAIPHLVQNDRPFHSYEKELVLDKVSFPKTPKKLTPHSLCLLVSPSASSKKQTAGSDKWALIRTLAQTYGLEILEALEEKPLRYTDLANYSPNERTRSQRLKELEALELISTAILKVNKRNFVHYELTDKGRQVRQRIKDIVELE